MRLAFAELLKSEHLYLPLNPFWTSLPAVISLSLGLSFKKKNESEIRFVLFYEHSDYCAIIIITKDEPSKELYSLSAM
jgi:hypothetical protein